MNFSDAFYAVYDLSAETNADHFLFRIVGNGNITGSYTVRLSNPVVPGVPLSTASNMVNAIQISDYLNYLTGTFDYTDRYGQIGQHDPEEFFRRVFVNKFDQPPTPQQIARGIDEINRQRLNLNQFNVFQIQGNLNQVAFLQEFISDNSILTFGGFNYTSRHGMPNIPIDAQTFAESAVIFSALIGRAPTNAGGGKTYIDSAL